MSPQARSSLRVVPARMPGTEGWSAFCSHCGRRPEGDLEEAPRVCGSCGMGLVLHCPSEVAPGPGVAFLVVDSSLAVGAVSGSAERFLDVQEAQAVHRPVTDLIEGAEVEPGGVDLGGAIMAAAGGDTELRQVFVRPTDTFGVRCRARIGPCGAPSAAVIVLEESV